MPLTAPWMLPAPAAAPRAPPDPLARCLLLALLLHVWLVLLLGSAPGGTAQPGQGHWGALNVTLRGAAVPGASTEPSPPVLPGGSAGQATQPRWGGAVRQADSPNRAEPGAARLGAWDERPPPVEPLAPRLASPLQGQPAPLARAPGLDRLAPLSPAPVRLPEAPAALPPLAGLSRLAALPAAATPPQPTLGAIHPAGPVHAAPLAAPVTVPRALPAPAFAAAPLPAADVAVPEEPALRRIDRALPAAPPLQPAQAALPRPEPLAPMPAPVAASLAASPAASPAVSPAVLGPPLPGLAGTAPDAGPRVGHDVATPPSNTASAPPRLNLELARPRGGELSRGSALGALPVLPRPPEMPDKLARDIEKAARRDCSNAYSGAGLLAPIPLVVDALRKDGGCKW